MCLCICIYIVYGLNTQISSRGDYTQLPWGVMVAIPSGLGVAFGVTSDQVSALIGTAISAALLPPIVNSGLTFAWGIILYINTKVPHDVTYKYLLCGGVSMLLFIINWLCIFISGWFTFRFLKKLNDVKSLQYQENLKTLLKSEHENIIMADLTPNKKDQKRHSLIITSSKKKKTKNMLSTPLLEDSMLKQSFDDTLINSFDNYKSKSNDNIISKYDNNNNNSNKKRSDSIAITIQNDNNNTSDNKKLIKMQSENLHQIPHSYTDKLSFQ